MTFLKQTAQRIYDYHGASLRDVWVILPTRRAVSVFLAELAQCSDRPFLAPHALAVDDFIAQAAGLQQIDSVSLLFELYDVFREIDPTVEFEQFVGWAPVLLTDFDRIDQYLIDTKALFSNLTAVKRLEAWNLELPPGAAPSAKRRVRHGILPCLITLTKRTPAFRSGSIGRGWLIGGWPTGDWLRMSVHSSATIRPMNGSGLWGSTP
ncbi:hypothetical protein [Spirosoma rhododendri]|uniref:hypothetical protein n=1 Tax=Spirosoma rhododendri TaxID=2728024 RepID=UPI0020C27CE5|nr:hypothetical protein [Spirosoma rhododendri]